MGMLNIASLPKHIEEIRVILAEKCLDILDIHLIRLRQKAFVQGDQDRFRQLRNLVNRKRKVLRNSYYTTKVANLKFAKPSQWWSEVKKIAGMGSCDANWRYLFCSSNHWNQRKPQTGSEKFIADIINSALLEPMHEYQPLDSLDTIDVNSEVIKLDVSSVHTSIRTLNPRAKLPVPTKYPRCAAPGPDDVKISINHLSDLSIYLSMANCGKTLILNPLNCICRTFTNPATTSFDRFCLVWGTRLRNIFSQ